MKAEQEIEIFLTEWKQSGQSSSLWFERFFSMLKDDAEVELSFVSRPGVSFSMRPKKRGQERALFAIIDVIDDDPTDRWLSVCFYEDMISDPEESGQVVPGGLGGENGYCFDIFDEDMLAYVLARVSEARSRAI